MLLVGHDKGHVACEIASLVLF